MVHKRFIEILNAGIAYNDELFPDPAILLQKIFVSLKITLTSFVKHKETGIGVIAIIRHNIIRQFAVANQIVNTNSIVIQKWAFRALFETLVVTAAAWVKVKLPNTFDFIYFTQFLLKKVQYTLTVAATATAKADDGYLHV